MSRPSPQNNSCSVFIGNIPHDTTEEQLKEIFSQIGPLKNLRLVYDAVTKKSKNYGFCLYHDQDTAMSAVRNLNQHEIDGRSLRVSIAARKEKSDQVRSNSPSGSVHGAEVDSDKATEAISVVVASMPPEEMSELMAEMKKSFETFPNETRQMLIANPQLVYALLQTQVAMGIVEPEAATDMLQPENNIQALFDLNKFDPSIRPNQPPPIPPFIFPPPPPPVNFHQFNFPPPPIQQFNYPPPPSYQNDRPSFPNHEDDRPPPPNRQNDRPPYQRRQNDRPPPPNRQNDRPPYQRGQNDRPPYPRRQNDRPNRREVDAPRDMRPNDDYNRPRPHAQARRRHHNNGRD